MKIFLILSCFEELVSYGLDEISSFGKVCLLCLYCLHLLHCQLNAGGAVTLWRLFCTNLHKICKLFFVIIYKYIFLEPTAQLCNKNIVNKKCMLSSLKPI